MKRLHGAMAVATLLAFSVGARTVYTQQQGGRGRQGGPPTYRLWWAAKAKPGQYGTNKPHIKLVDLKARHKGQANWMEVVVNDENWHAEYNQGAPGFKIAPRMRPDTREFFAVVEGQMRFTLEGQAAPISATPTSIINIPKKTAYSVEVIGDAPALWVDANQQNYRTLYPVADGQKPAQEPGFTVMKIGLNVPTPGPTREQQTAFQSARGGEGSVVHGPERRPGRSHVGAGHLGLREEPAALRSERQGALPHRHRGMVGDSGRADSSQYRNRRRLHLERG